MNQENATWTTRKWDVLKIKGMPGRFLFKSLVTGKILPGKLANGKSS